MTDATQTTDRASQVVVGPTVADAIGEALWDLGVELLVDARMDRDAEPGIWLHEAFASH